MDLSEVHILKKEHIKRLELWKKNKEQWENLKADYQALKQRVETLPNALSYDVTVPFGSNAFTMGKIVNTNEVLVLLGDNWFAEVSAKQAVAIADRRLLQCHKMLEDLEKEKIQHEKWLEYIDIVSNDELVDIREEFDEEKEKEWREQHSKNMKAYHHQLAEERKNLSSSDLNTKTNSDDELFERLEELELMESMNSDLSVLEDSLINLNNVNSEPVDHCKTNESDEQNGHVITENNIPKCVADKTKEVKKGAGLKLNINCTANDTFLHETESCDDEDDCSKSDEVSPSFDNAESSEKHVRWQDLSKQKFKKITFRHSKSKLHSHSKQPTKRQDSSESEESHPIIQSPSDIYKHFGSMFQVTSPKSILKVKNSLTSPEANQFFGSLEELIPKDNSPELKSGNMTVAFTGQVCENSSPVHIVEKKSSRPVSHFKSSRKNKKKLSH